MSPSANMLLWRTFSQNFPHSSLSYSLASLVPILPIELPWPTPKHPRNIMDRYAISPAQTILQVYMLSPGRTTPGPCSGGSSPEDQSFSPWRVQQFLREPVREGNVLIALPDQTPDVKSSSQDKEKEMRAQIETFEKRFNQKSVME